MTQVETYEDTNIHLNGQRRALVKEAAKRSILTQKSVHRTIVIHALHCCFQEEWEVERHC